MERKLTDEESLALKNLLFEKLKTANELRDKMISIKCVCGMGFSEYERMSVTWHMRTSGVTESQFRSDMSDGADIDGLLDEAKRLRQTA